MMRIDPQKVDVEEGFAMTDLQIEGHQEEEVVVLSNMPF
jgi:hypothetical protein